MSKFDELLSRPLPSAIMESGTEDLDKAMDSMDKNNTDTQSSSTSDPSMKEGCKEGCNEGKCGSEGCSNEHDHDLCDNNHCDSMHDHIEDLHDHLEDLHDHMHGGDSHDLTDKHYNTGNDTEVLSPDESQRADDVINAVATPLMLNGELSEAEINEFVESADSDIAIAEGLLTERTIVKFDKNAKRAQLYEVAVAACAREHNDPDFRKLQTVYKMERILKKKLRKKYNSQAQKKVKEYLVRAKKSKSGIISRIAHKITGK